MIMSFKVLKYFSNGKISFFLFASCFIEILNWKFDGFFFISKNLGVVLNNYLSKYEHIILLRDFNLTTSNKYLADFMTLFNLESLINTLTCFQSEKPRCINLILTNNNSLLFDHHHLLLTLMRSQCSG